MMKLGSEEILMSPHMLPLDARMASCSHACVSTDRVRFLFFLDSLLWFEGVYLAVQTNLNKSVESELIIFLFCGKERENTFLSCAILLPDDRN